MKLRPQLAIALGLPDDERAFSIAQAWLDTPDSNARKRADLVLRTLRHKQPEKPLSDALDDPALRMFAGNAMWRLGKPAVRQLSAKLLHPAEDVRAFAIGLIEYYYTHGFQVGWSRRKVQADLAMAVPNLIRILRGDTVDLRAKAAEVLGVMSSEEALGPLIAAIGDESSHVAQQAIAALGNIPDSRTINPLGGLLDSGDARLRAAAVNALSYLAVIDDNYYLPSDKRLLLSKGKGVAEQARDQIMEHFQSLLSDPELKVRKTTVRALGWTSNASAVEPLLDLLQNREREPIDVIVQTLGLIGDRRATEALIALLTGDTAEDEVRASAAEALGLIGDRRALSPLLATLADETTHYWVRSAAIEALYPFRGIAIAPLLIEVALNRDENAHVRIIATKTLGRRREKSAVEPLLILLSDDAVRAEAITSLGFLRANSVVDNLLALLSSSERHITYRVVVALGSIGDTRAVQPLIALLQTMDLSEHEGTDVRSAIARSLGNIGDQSALEMLEQVRKHDVGICCGTYEARYAAARAIRNINRRRNLRT